MKYNICSFAIRKAVFQILEIRVYGLLGLVSAVEKRGKPEIYKGLPR